MNFPEERATILYGLIPLLVRDPALLEAIDNTNEASLKSGIFEAVRYHISNLSKIADWKNQLATAGLPGIVAENGIVTWQNNSDSLPALIAAAAVILDFHPARADIGDYLDRYSLEQAQTICAFSPWQIVSAGTVKELHHALVPNKNNISIIITTSESLQGKNNATRLLKKNCTAVLIDEANSAQNPNAKEHRFLANILEQIAKKTPTSKVALLTGTPFNNNSASCIPIGSGKSR